MCGGGTKWPQKQQRDSNGGNTTNPAERGPIFTSKKLPNNSDNSRPTAAIGLMCVESERGEDEKGVCVEERETDWLKCSVKKCRKRRGEEMSLEMGPPRERCVADQGPTMGIGLTTRKRS